MKKMICFTIILFVFLSCQSPLERFDCQKVDYIDVYFVPFDIMSPIEITKEHIKLDLHRKTISDKERIEKVCKEILSLKEQKGAGFMDGKIHLRIDFSHNEKEVLTILSDGNTFKIGRRIYELDTELLNLLIE